MSCLSLIPKQNSNAANVLITIITIDFMAFPRLSGVAKLVKILVGIFDSMKFPSDLVAALLNSKNFLNISALLEQKLAKAITANPSYRIERKPPIILNHSSNIVFPD
jgi:hypothetical protein